MQMDLLLFIQSFANGFLDMMFIALSFIGDEEFYMAVVPLIFLGVHKQVGVRLGMVLAFSTFANEAMKWFFATPRPIGVEGIRNLYVESAPGYSFPSGHSQGSATFWFYLATQVKRGWFTVCAAVLVLLIMLSRMYLGVHWPIDVLGGLVFGLLAVSAFVWVDAWQKARGLPLWVMVAGAVLVPLGLLLVYQEPDGRKMVGFLIGFGVAYLIEKETVGMRLAKRWTRRILPVLVGVGGVFLLRALLKSVLPEEAPFDMLRYVIIGFWGAWVAPWLFVKVGWYPGKGTQHPS
ncbi:phosphatase PAP2 family protein [Tumebacillus sp. DT12]|uniref:Phosphatase PAP2 family protein n=1 Tax=Tumebacillus lacus TaxID=2995335 RepID=A0ABT3XBB1_9BACL|nr:phosphatase PAP2 family protein [Tumebacillus lacus]MCX7572044.1 phosphatase PAP2 family protein [Tumebacillus lacus]